MFSAALYARVHLFYNFAHETAGAARIRHSLLPHFFEGDNDMKTSGRSCRENAGPHLYEIRIKMPPRHCERSEAIHFTKQGKEWIASLRSQ